MTIYPITLTQTELDLLEYFREFADQQTSRGDRHSRVLEGIIGRAHGYVFDASSVQHSVGQ